MNIVDTMSLRYEVIKPTQGAISGFSEDNRMIVKKPLDGSDLGFGSHWTITKVGNKVSFHALNAPSIWSRRIYNMSDIRRHFDRY